MAAAKRLRRELQELKKNPEKEISLFPINDSIKNWKGFISGPCDTPFEGMLYYYICYDATSIDLAFKKLRLGGVFELTIITSNLYPMEPPKISFLTPCFHPNINFKTGGRRTLVSHHLAPPPMIIHWRTPPLLEICIDILKNEWSPAWTLSVRILVIQFFSLTNKMS